MPGQDFTTIISIATIALQAGVVFGFILYLINPNHKIFDFLGRRGAFIGFLIASSAVLGSFVYSEIIGFPPCKLCWYGRVAVFPQVVLFGLLASTKEKVLIKAINWILGFGILISLYHLLVEWSDGAISCGAGIGEVSCDARYVFEFGFMTIPLMELTILLALLGLGFIVRKKRII